MSDLKIIKFLMSPSDIKTIFELKGTEQQYTQHPLPFLPKDRITYLGFFVVAFLTRDSSAHRQHEDKPDS